MDLLTGLPYGPIIGGGSTIQGTFSVDPPVPTLGGDVTFTLVIESVNFSYTANEYELTEGEDLILTAESSLTFQLMLDGEPVLGADEAVNVISGWQESDNGEYTIVVTDTLRGITETFGPLSVVAEVPEGPQFVGQKVVQYTGNGGAQTISLTDLTGGSASAPIEGDLVVVAIGHSNIGNRLTTIGVNTAGYVVAGSAYANAVRDANLEVSYKVMTSTPDTSVEVVVSNTSTYPSVVAVQVWRGVDAATPMDVTATTSSAINTADPDPAAITPTTTGAVILVIGSGTTGTGAATEELGLIAGYLSNQSSGVAVNGTTFHGSALLMGSVEWTSGEYDPAAFTSDATDTGNSVASVTMALRPI